MNRAWTALVALAIAATAPSCGSSYPADVIPRLPGDGNTNTARPQLPPDPNRPTGNDPWSERDDLITPSSAAAVPLTLPKVETFTLANGLSVVLITDPSLPVAAMQLAVRAGRSRETIAKPGLAEMTASALAAGTRVRTSKGLRALVEKAGLNLSTDTTFEASLISCSALADNAQTCMDVIGDLVSAPLFPNQRLERVRAGFYTQLRSRPRDLPTLASAHFQNQLYGTAQVRGRPLSRTGIRAIKRADMVAFHQKFYRPNNAVLVLSGKLSRAGAEAMAKRAFGRWIKRAVPIDKKPKAPVVKGIAVRLVDAPAAREAHVRVGQVGVSRNSPMFFDALVINQVLRERLRAKRAQRELGIRAASSDFDRTMVAGAWLLSATTTPDTAVRVARLLMDETSRMASGGPTDAEVAAAKLRLRGQYETRFGSASDFGSALLVAYLHSRATDSISSYPVSLGKVTAASAKAVAAKLLSRENHAVVIVGPGAALASKLESAGWKFSMLRSVEPIDIADRKQAEKDARAILDRALVAKGGAARLKAMKSFEWSGTATLNNPQQPASAKVMKRFARPDKLRLDMQITANKTTLVTTLAGKTGWAMQQNPSGKRVIDFPGGEIAAAQAQLWRDPDLVLLRHLEKGSTVFLEDDYLLENRPHHAVRVTSADKKYSVVVFVEKRTRLLGGMTYQEVGPDGKLGVSEERYSDYRMISGIKFAFRRASRNPMLDIRTVLSRAVVNKKLPDSVFARPKD